MRRKLVSVLTSYYSYDPYDSGGIIYNPTTDFPPVGQATLAEAQLRLKQAGAAFKAEKYNDALKLYLEVYAWIYQFLHPGFPTEAVASNPQLVAHINISDALLKVSAELLSQPAEQAAQAASLPLMVEDVPAALWQLVESHSSAPAEARRTDKYAYASAVASLKAGDWQKALHKLQVASQLNTTRDAVLDAHIAAAQGAAQILSGKQTDALASLTKAKQLYTSLGLQQARTTVDNNLGVSFTLAGNTEAAAAAFDAAEQLLPAGNEAVAFKDANRAPAVAVVPVQRPTSRPSININLTVFDGQAQWLKLPPTLEGFPRRSLKVRLPVGAAMKELDLSQDGASQLIANFYQPRVTATNLTVLKPNYEDDNVFRATLSHIYSLVLPLSIGDCYVALGRRMQAVEFYLKVLQYKYLNPEIEALKVWLKAAQAIVEEADEQYKQGVPTEAKRLYEQVLLSSDTLPTTSSLYNSPSFSKIGAIVTSALQAIQKDQAFSGNSEVLLVTSHVKAQLAKIAANLNWLGLPEEGTPIFSFDFLQQTARYYAQHAIQAYREYINFRTSAEQAQMTAMQLSQAIVMAQNALNVQIDQRSLAVKQFNVAQEVKDSATLHRNNLITARNQFNTIGWVVADLDRFQMWYANASNNMTFQGAHWDWGPGLSLTVNANNAQSFLDQIAHYRNQLTHQLQVNNYNQQISEAEQQIAVAQAQVAAAQAQVTVANTQLAAAKQQVAFAKQNEAHFRNNEFTPALWQALAHQIKKIANDYLKRAMSVAYMMEQAYNVENDRGIKRIRLSYAEPSTHSLTAGDSLLQDIDSFTLDLLSSTKGRRNFVRHVVSLADFAPQAFNQFRQSGKLEFTLPMQVFDRAYPGSYLHRVQNIEIEIEGLQVPEGITGKLMHLGISAWRRENGDLRQRVTAPETMLISGFRLRRDLALYRAEAGRQNLFENSGVAGSWFLEVPASANDIDYTTISDVRFVMYFQCQHSPTLETKIRATFPTSSEASQSLSARLHAPDQFFSFGSRGSNAILFDLNPRVFPYNQRNQVTTQVGVQVLRTNAIGRAEPFAAVPLTVKLAGQSAGGTTNRGGLVASGLGDTTLGALLNKPVGPVEVTFSGPAEQRAAIADVLLTINYKFDYR